jgi:hypothetical protein
MAEHTIEEKKIGRFVNTGFRVCEISKVNFCVETKILVSMSEEI